MSGLVRAIVRYWPCSKHVCEYKACVRNIEMGQISVGVCDCKQKQYAAHARIQALCGTIHESMMVDG